MLINRITATGAAFFGLCNARHEIVRCFHHILHNIHSSDYYQSGKEQYFSFRHALVIPIVEIQEIEHQQHAHDNRTSFHTHHDKRHAEDDHSILKKAFVTE